MNSFAGRPTSDSQRSPVDPNSRGDVEVLVHVRLAATTQPATFETYLHSEPGVLHVWHTAGDIDFEVHLACQGIGELHALLTRARSLGGAQETTTHLILRPAGPDRTRTTIERQHR